MFIPVILPKSERRRSEDAWKGPEDFSSIHNCIREFSQYLVRAQALVSSKMFIPVILTKSERRRSEGAWKDPEDFSSIHTASGSSHNTSAFLRTIHHHVLSEGSCGTARGPRRARFWLVGVDDRPRLCVLM